MGKLNDRLDYSKLLIEFEIAWVEEPVLMG